MMRHFYRSVLHPFRGLVSILLVSLCLQVLVSSCARRPLEDEGGVTALVPFQIDWSKSGLDLLQIRRASIWFFPHDGSSSFEWCLEGDLTKATVPLAAGKYSLVVFNETIDATDWKFIAFDGNAKYETFRVYATLSDFDGLFVRTERSDLRNTPEAIASWSLDKLEVTPDMIAYTRGLASRGSGGDALGASLDALSTITPLPLTIGTHVQAYVTNLKSARLCSAALWGATGAISLATGRPIPGVVTHVFPLDKRTYDVSNPLNGTIETEPFLLFKLQEEDVKYELQLDFKLHDGTKMPPESFNITDQVNRDKFAIEVKLGVSETDPEQDHPINLPKIDIGNDVGVGDWTDAEEIPIK